MIKTEFDDTMLADPNLLEKIDKLFACNVGEYISLPQLVVVGDQSSGKSSVLEGLTKLSFPRDSGLCTRFATQIMFRRDVKLENREISASIIPASGNADEDQKLRAWKVSGLETLGEIGFMQMMRQVHELLNLSDSDCDGKPTFSNSVLRLEICGPQENHLSVIDVPGIFKNTTSGRTTKNDILRVRNMVLRYMKNRRSVMLTVVPANVDIATQEIIEMAKELDPEGERTLRILTKPDLVDKGAENRVIDLIEGQANSHLGWVLVRNLGQQELVDGNNDRDSMEELFYQKEPWNRLRAGSFGIKALKNRLQEILASIVRREFPSVRSEVIKKLKESRKALESLGIERQAAEQQRMLLLDIISFFQEITQQALTTNYSVHDIFDTDEDIRLATLVSNRNITFSNHVQKWGHTFSLFANTRPEEENPGVDIPLEPEFMQSKPAPVTSRGVSEISGDTSVEPEMGDGADFIQSRRIQEDETFLEILHDTARVQASQDGIEAWIERIHREARGFEIGTFNYTLLSTLMKKQSAKWPILAQGYISDVIAMVHRFIHKALQAASGDSTSGDGRISANILALLWDNLMDNAQHTIRDIHDILESYYKVARKRFVDNVCMQAADHFLVTGPAAPMKLFSPSWVNSLSDDKLREIAGEDVKTQRRRRQLRKEIEELEAGRKVLLA